MSPFAPGFTGRVCVTGAGGNAGVHYHAYVEHVTARQIVLRRRRAAGPHRFRRDPPHTSIPNAAAGALTVSAHCTRPEDPRP